MRFLELQEGVSAKGNAGLTAYMITVAESYEAAPLRDDRAVAAWQALNRSTMDKLMKRLAGGQIDVQYTKGDPYAAYTDDPRQQIKYMLYDMVVFHRLIIFTGSSEHPVFSEEENVAFRAVHDFFAHGKIRKSFFEQLSAIAKRLKIQKLPEISEAKSLLDQIDMSKFGNGGFLFNGRGELNAAAAHIRLAPKQAAPALFCEVVGQVSFQIISGHFGEQKVAILDGFDYQHLGRCQPGSEQEERMHQIMRQIASGAKTLDTTLGQMNTQAVMQRVSSGVA